MADQPVAFRRINGRVVPIRISNNAQAGGKVAAGVTAAGIAGAVSAHIHREAAGFENVSKSLVKVAVSERAQGSLFHRAADRTFRLAAKNRLEAGRLFKAGKLVQKGGMAAGAALIGAGVHQALSQTGLKDSPKTKAAIAGGSGLAAAFAIRSMYLRTIGPMRGFDVLKQAAKRVAARGLKL